MTNKKKVLVYASLVLMFTGLFMPLTLAKSDTDLDGLSGGMTSDGSSIVTELMFWLVGIALCFCVILTATGVASSNADKTSNGIKGILFIIAVVAFFYVARFAIIFLKAKYG